MIVGGIVLNIDEESLSDRIKNSNKNQKIEKKESEGGLISGFFGYFSIKK